MTLQLTTSRDVTLRRSQAKWYLHLHELYLHKPFDSFNRVRGWKGQVQPKTDRTTINKNALGLAMQGRSQPRYLCLPPSFPLSNPTVLYGGGWRWDATRRWMRCRKEGENCPFLRRLPPSCYIRAAFTLECLASLLGRGKCTCRARLSRALLQGESHHWTMYDT